MNANLRQRIADALSAEDVKWGYHCGFSTNLADDDCTAAFADAVLAEVQPELDQLRAELEQARASVRRLNYRAQRAESTVATIARAVRDWQFTERGTYMPLRSLAAIARTVGRPVPDGRFELHYQRVEQLTTELDRTRAHLEAVRMVIETPAVSHLIPLLDSPTDYERGWAAAMATVEGAMTAPTTT